MASKVIVIELQNDNSVTKQEVTPTFPWKTKNRLCIVTTQKSHLHLVHHESTEKNLDSRKDPEEKSTFQYGVSTKVFAVTDETGSALEVRLLLSPSEVSRLSTFFHLTGFANTCLASKEYRDSLAVLGGRPPKQEDVVREICTAATRFVCLPEERIVSSDYTNKLYRVLSEKVQVTCMGQNETSLVVGTLVALVAAELAVSVGASQNFDYDVKENQEDQGEQIKQIIQAFDVSAELLTVSHQGKRVHIIFRNPSPENWATGGEKPTELHEKLVFGMCHKVLSFSMLESEIQFLQSLQESHDMVSVFHLPAFVEHLLKVSDWRDDIGLFLKERNQKEIINKLSHLAVSFVCSEKCQGETFMKWFRKDMLEKWSSVESIAAGGEAMGAFGILLAVMAALTAKSIADGCKGAFTDSEDEKIEETQESSVDTTSVSDIPETDVSPKSSETSDASNVSLCEMKDTTNSISIVPETGVSPNSSETSDASNVSLCELKDTTNSISDVPETGVSPNSSETSDASNVSLCELKDTTNSISDVPETGVSPKSSETSDASSVSSHEIMDAPTNAGRCHTSPDEFSSLNTQTPEGTPWVSNADSQEIIVNSTLMDPMRASTEVTNLHPSTVGEDDGHSTGLAEDPSSDAYTAVGIPATGPDMTTDFSTQTVNEDYTLEPRSSSYGVSNVSEGVSNVGIPETSDGRNLDTLVVNIPGSLTDSCKLTTGTSVLGVCDNGRPEPNMDDGSVLSRNRSADDNRTTDRRKETGLDYQNDATPNDLATPLLGPEVSGDTPLCSVSGGGADDSVTEHLTSKGNSDSSASPQEARSSTEVEFSNKRESPSGVNAMAHWFIGIILLIILTMVLNAVKLLSLQTSSVATIVAVILAFIFWARRP